MLELDVERSYEQRVCVGGHCVSCACAVCVTRAG